MELASYLTLGAQRCGAPPRAAGLLMPLASLPSPEGAGCLGAESFRFVDLLADMGFTVWQLLPLNPLGFGNSPYAPFSSLAGDTLYLSLAQLHADGLLPEYAPCPPAAAPDRIDYGAARAWREPLLRAACDRFLALHGGDRDFLAFCEKPWVRPYAVFRALKALHGERAWTDWPQPQRDWCIDSAYDLAPLLPEVQRCMAAQYLFARQWRALRDYANRKGLLIMGDLPFYVGLDSLEVWQHREGFLMDRDGRLHFVAGVPPDGFSDSGQRWGNPIYDWDAMERTGFRFWLERLRGSAELYDILRIDHFRAFDTYWKIPADCPTAIDGVWTEAPGRALFETLRREAPELRIVVEDLGGDLTESMARLRDDFGLMGMNVADFTIWSGVRPGLHQLTCTGNHDNSTVRGYYASMSRSAKARFRELLAPYGKPREAVSKRMLRYVLGCDSVLAVIPLADFLDLDDRACLNRPGTVGSPNWEWRLADYRLLEKKHGAIRALLAEGGRLA